MGESLASQTRRAPDPVRVRLLLVAVLTCSLVLGAGCGSTRERGGVGTDSSSEAPSAPDPGVVHVHGLGVNPKDGALFAATHTGLFRIAEGKAERIAGRYQDTMGFTVIGPDHFLGSGHPDLRDYRDGKLPGLMGLMESKNAGQTWTSQSLLGKADFHGLAYAHGRAYGFDSTGGRFMVSNDGKTWDTRASINLLSFSVNPVDPDLILGTTDRGLQVSRDGGRTWSRLPAPSLVLVAWPDTDLVIGLDAKGTTYVTHDEGRTWKENGTLAGPPAALVATSGRLYAAVHEQGIYRSDDLGVSWRIFYKQPD